MSERISGRQDDRLAEVAVERLSAANASGINYTWWLTQIKYTYLIAPSPAV